MKRLFTLLSLFLALCVTAAELRGKCIRVTDGDTITVEEKDGGKFRIRLAGIDAPENTQPFGKESKAYLSLLLLNQEVTVKFKDIDHYGRIIGRVECSGKDASKMMLKSGLAWHYSYFDGDKESSNLQKKAQESKIGLWSDEDPVPPWEYRSR